MEQSGRQLNSLKSELASTVEITKQQQDALQNLRWLEDRVPDAQKKFAEMERKVAYESSAYRDMAHSQVKLETLLMVYLILHGVYIKDLDLKEWVPHH